jgi:hypothetical protein
MSLMPAVKNLGCTASTHPLKLLSGSIGLEDSQLASHSMVSFKGICHVVKVAISQKNDLAKFGYILPGTKVGKNRILQYYCLLTGMFHKI